MIAIWLRRHFIRIFWVCISFILILGLPRLLTDPTTSSARSNGSLIINEFLAVPTHLHEEGEATSDSSQSLGAGWIEIYNQSNHRVEMSDWFLTDEPDRPTKWRFPEMSLEPQEYLLVWTANSVPINAVENQSAIYSEIRLSAEGGFLALYDSTSRRFIDGTELDYPQQFVGESMGRVTSSSAAGFGYLTVPTPGQENATARWMGIAPTVAMDVERGFYSEPFYVRLTTQSDSAQVRGATIRYTLDGSEPTETNGMDYANPIRIDETTTLRAVSVKAGYRTTASTVQTYIFTTEVLNQPDNPVNFPQDWGTHRITLFGYQEGEPVAPDYAMDAKIAQDLRYRETLLEGLRAIPSISLVTAQENLDIYFLDPQMRGSISERPVSVEILYPDAPEHNLQINAGLRIQGGAGRWQYMPKHSFRLFFRGRYGAPKLRHDLFPNSGVEAFDTLILRAGADRSYAGNPDTSDHIDNHRLATYTRDEWARMSQIEMMGAGSHGIFVHLYLNGLYWGLYNLVERPDSAFSASYFGGEREKWFTASHGGSGDGQSDRFITMLTLADAGGLVDPEKYATMLEFVDPVQFSDYLVLQWYIGNRDWPENNWYVNVSYPAGRNLFFVWDAENSWNNGAQIRLGPDGLDGAPFPNVTKIVFEALMENPDFRLTVADRMYASVRPGGVLSDERASERWQAVSNQVETAIVAESARWGDARYEPPITIDDWLSATAAVLKQMDGNGARLIELAQALGYYPSIAPPQFARGGVEAFSGPIDDSTELSIVADAGTIYYTLDGSDPRQPQSGNISASATTYTEPLHLTEAISVMARARSRDGEWSALAEIELWHRGQESNVRISEIMYHPLADASGGSDAYEFIEIQNRGERTADLSNVYFEGIGFHFPLYTTLKPGAYMTVVADFRKFRSRYPFAEVHGVFEGRLSDRGETISLNRLSGEVLDSVTYDDANGWPLSADGSGDSLVRLPGQGNASLQQQQWRVSEQIHGSPSSD